MHKIINLRSRFHLRILIILKLTQGCCLNCGHLSVGHLDTVIGIPACGGRVFFIKVGNGGSECRKGVDNQTINSKLIQTTLRGNILEKWNEIWNSSQTSYVFNMHHSYIQLHYVNHCWKNIELIDRNTKMTSCQWHWRRQRTTTNNGGPRGAN